MHQAFTFRIEYLQDVFFLPGHLFGFNPRRLFTPFYTSACPPACRPAPCPILLAVRPRPPFRFAHCPVLLTVLSSARRLPSVLPIPEHRPTCPPVWKNCLTQNVVFTTFAFQHGPRTAYIERIAGSSGIPANMRRNNIPNFKFVITCATLSGK